MITSTFDTLVCSTFITSFNGLTLKLKLKKKFKYRLSFLIRCVGIFLSVPEPHFIAVCHSKGNSISSVIIVLSTMISY